MSDSSNAGNATSGPPPETSLKTGDLLFPRPKDGVVVYLSGAAKHASDYSEEEREWLNIRKRIANGEGEIPQTARDEIASMSYNEFRVRYGGEGGPGLFGIQFYTGHVAIFDAGNVIEALWGGCDRVIERPYAVWADKHADHLVWQSRFADRSDAELCAFCEVARQQVNVPYNFFNFDLSDNSGFYCSKLVWYAVWKAMKFEPDNDPVTLRLFWYSPKQLLHSQHLAAIQAPANY
jgi:hypothetical protein